MNMLPASSKIPETAIIISNTSFIDGTLQVAQDMQNTSLIYFIYADECIHLVGCYELPPTATPKQVTEELHRVITNACALGFQQYKDARLANKTLTLQ